MKYDFTYSNLNIIKAKYCINQNQILAEFIIDVLTKIDLTNVELKNSYIEVFKNTRYGISVNFNLISKSSISMNINANENYIDFIVNDNTTIYEMYKVENISKFFNYFIKWFENNIIETTYIKFGFIYVNKFEDSNGYILFKSTNYFYSSLINKICYENKYDAWILK